MFDERNIYAFGFRKFRIEWNIQNRLEKQKKKDDHQNSKNSDKVFYRGDQQFDALELHQIYFINLRVMRLFNTAAALIVTKIDNDEKLLEFTYIEGNKSTGKQTVRLIETDDSETKIVHDTFYKSGSKFRD